MVTQAVQIGLRSVQFYIAFGSDSAVLGFFVEHEPGRRRYFPLYGSTYRGLPPVTLDVFASRFQEELWVYSSWPSYEILAYHRLGSDRCMTPYGEIASVDQPIPERLRGGLRHFPAMDAETTSRVATLTYDGERLTR